MMKAQVPEDHIPRAIPWFFLSIIGSIVVGFVVLTSSMVSSWANGVNSQILDNSRRVSVLERQYAVIEQMLLQNSVEHKEIKILLVESASSRRR